MPRKPRRTFTADQKAAILRRHHVDKVPVSELCEQNDLQPSLFYYWQRQLFENAASALRPPEPAAPSRALEAPADVRDAVIDFATEWSERTEIPVGRFITWIGVHRGKFYAWKERYGKANEHNGRIPRDHWLTPEEKEPILDFHEKHPLDGYRRLTFMMIDQDVVAVSPTTVHRVLSAAGRLDRSTRRPSRKGDLREAMKEADVERVIERARELHPGVSPRIISDNGPQFIAADFKTYIRLTGMTHVRTAPYYPQSNGKIERFHKTIKGDAIRPGSPANADEARRIIGGYVRHYNTERLHSAIDYVTPADRLAGRHLAIVAERDLKLEAARERRAECRREARHSERPPASSPEPLDNHP